MHPSEAFSFFFDVGKDVLFTFLDKTTNVILAQLGDSTTGTPDTDQSEWWQHVGISSRPAVPTKGSSSCQTVTLKRSDRDMVIATRDTRGTAIYGNLKDGETCIYAATGQARTLYKANGAIVHYTTSDNTTGGTSVTAYFGPDAIRLSNQFGGISIDSSGITLTTGQAALTLSMAGIAKLLGTQVAVQGSVAAISGSVSTCVGPNALPLNPVSACAYGPAGPVNIVSTNVFISP
jgi:phage gp45-like